MVKTFVPDGWPDLDAKVKDLVPIFDALFGEVTEDAGAVAADVLDDAQTATVRCSCQPASASAAGARGAASRATLRCAVRKAHGRAMPHFSAAGSDGRRLRARSCSLLGVLLLRCLRGAARQLRGPQLGAARVRGCSWPDVASCEAETRVRGHLGRPASAFRTVVPSLRRAPASPGTDAAAPGRLPPQPMSARGPRSLKSVDAEAQAAKEGSGAPVKQAGGQASAPAARRASVRAAVHAAAAAPAAARSAAAKAGVSKKAQAQAKAHAKKKCVTAALVHGRGRNTGRLVCKTGSAFPWTEAEDDQLRKAVAENSGKPNKRGNGISWAAIKRLAPTEYPLLALRTADKALSKHWAAIC